MLNFTVAHQERERGASLAVLWHIESNIEKLSANLTWLT